QISVTPESFSHLLMVSVQTPAKIASCSCVQLRARRSFATLSPNLVSPSNHGLCLKIPNAVDGQSWINCNILCQHMVGSRLAVSHKDTATRSIPKIDANCS